MSMIKEKSYTPPDLETAAGHDIVDISEKLCLRNVKPKDPNLPITSSIQNEGQNHNASCVGSTAPDLSVIRLEIENADEKGGCHVTNHHNTSGPSIPSCSGESDEFKFNTRNASDDLTIGQHKPISFVRKTVGNENWIKREPCSQTYPSPTPNTIHSTVNDMVSGNVDLDNDNDIAGKPLYGNNTPSMDSDCKTKSVKHDPTEGLLAEQQSGSNKPTLKKMQISETMSGKAISDTSRLRQKGNFACWICLKNYVHCSTVKKHLIQKHSLSRDLIALVQKDSEDSDNDSQLVWFCPRNCKYFTSEYNALSEHLVACQKPDFLSHNNMGDNVDIGNNLDPFEFDKDYPVDTSAESLMVHTKQTGQTSSILGQAEEMQTMDQDLNDIPTCQLCDSVFSTYLLLESHVKDCHKEQDTSSTHTGEKAFKCSHCDKSFRCSSVLNKHMTKHTGEKPFKCSHCDKSFRHSSLLNKHMTKHTGEKPFKCNHCDKSFRYSSGLYNHMKTVTGEKSFKCGHCGKSFWKTSGLHEHMRTHTGEKPFKCSDCDMSFRYSGALNVHMRIHTGEKPFKCIHCDKSFRKHSCLNVHMRTHTGEKPFKCSHCDKSFTQSSGLNEHMRTLTGEKPFKCGHCDKSFRKSSGLKEHMRTHTGEKPFKCSHCDKSFRKRSGLNVHLRLHTGEKPFKCSHCDKDFRHNSHFLAHIKTHTGE